MRRLFAAAPIVICRLRWRAKGKRIGIDRKAFLRAIEPARVVGCVDLDGADSQMLRCE
jgi:hypothetical protein